jgi:septal ring factor EnvC (AmiA/AmiB activator)
MPPTKRKNKFGTIIMKQNRMLLAFLALAVVTVGCDKRPTTSQEIEKLQTETKKVTQGLNEQDYPYAQKTEFTEKLNGQLAEINRDLDQLSARIENSSDAVKAEARPKLQALRNQAAKLSTHLDGAKSATESTWDSVKGGSKKAYAELKDGFIQARQWVSEKIAP